LKIYCIFLNNGNQRIFNEKDLLSLSLKKIR
jgi:hypothetical protein